MEEGEEEGEEWEEEEEEEEEEEHEEQQQKSTSKAGGTYVAHVQGQQEASDVFHIVMYMYTNMYNTIVTFTTTTQGSTNSQQHV